MGTMHLRVYCEMKMPTCAMVWSEKKNVRQYVNDAIDNPYSKNIRTVGKTQPLPIN
jgi:hypothetical protein